MTTNAPQIILPNPGEFDRQVQLLVKRIWPQTTGIKKDDFIARILPLKKRLKSIPSTAISDYALGKLPFVIVIPTNWLAVEKMVPMITWLGSASCDRRLT